MVRPLLMLQLLLIAVLPLAGARAGPGAAAYARTHGLPLHFTNEFGMRFRLVPPAQFTMGRGASAHAVRLHLPFYLQQGECSEAMVRRIRGDVAGDGTRPAHLRTHARAVALGQRLDQADRLRTYRLPTEAEWVRACRQAGALGLADMQTGLAAWCSDRYGPYAGNETSDPIGPPRGGERVYRGGSGLRCTLRGHAPPTETVADVGVRFVAEIGWHGDREVRIRTVARDLEGAIVETRPGYRLRLIRILDRLADRQAGHPAEWTELPGTSPLTLHMFPGRYYLMAVDHDAQGREREGREAKIIIGAGPHTFDVDIPGPRIDRTKR